MNLITWKGSAGYGNDGGVNEGGINEGGVSKGGFNEGAFSMIMGLAPAILFVQLD